MKLIVAAEVILKVVAASLRITTSFNLLCMGNFNVEFLNKCHLNECLQNLQKFEGLMIFMINHNNTGFMIFSQFAYLENLYIYSNCKS